MEADNPQNPTDAGYFHLAVASMDEALSYARACPILEYGAEVEVRPIADPYRPMAEVKQVEIGEGRQAS